MDFAGRIVALDVAVVATRAERAGRGRERVVIHAIGSDGGSQKQSLIRNVVADVSKDNCSSI